jgi:hypothetical protein
VLLFTAGYQLQENRIAVFNGPTILVDPSPLTPITCHWFSESHPCLSLRDIAKVALAGLETKNYSGDCSWTVENRTF